MKMNNLIILPILIPLMAGIILLFLKEQVQIQRWISGIATIFNVLVVMLLVHTVSLNGIQVIELGSWPAPFGIVLVADMFAALLVLTTMVVGLACLFYAFHSIGEAREKNYFYAFFQFILVGVAGSFLTGDIFNLFVMFEVMLISSYALITLGGTRQQLRESIKYILINIVSSVLFVASVAYLYGVIGTLNFAHLSVRVASLDDPQGGIISVVAILFLIVFSLKAGLFLYFWLPGSYSVPPAVIAALFGGLLTKVGIYAIFRIFTLIFYHEPSITHFTIMAWMAGITMVIGMIGAIAHWDVKKILAYNIVYAVGFIIFGLAIFNQVALEGAIFYLLHDMFVKALLFLLAGAMIGIAGTSYLKNMGGLIKNHPMLGWMFFIAALALAGVPPLSGFIGKLLIVQGGLTDGFYWLVGLSLLTSLLILYSIMKIFMNGFWGEVKLSKEEQKASAKGLLAPCAFLLILSIGLGLGAEWVYDQYIREAAITLLDPAIYIDAVSPVKE